MTRPVIHHFGHMEFPEEHGLDDIDPMTVAIDQAAEYLRGTLQQLGRFVDVADNLAVLDYLFVGVEHAGEGVALEFRSNLCRL
jgi:hypothetical protein